MDNKALHKTIKRAMRGDQSAFESLYHAYARVIIFHTRDLLYNKEDVEDVAQEIVIQMLSSIGSLKSPYAFSTWLHQLIINECHNRNKAMRSQGQENSLETAEDLVDQNSQNMPEVAAEQKDIRTIVFENISRLPQMQRRVLIMHYYDQLSYKEIAQALGVEVGTVSSNLSKAKKNLEALLEDSQKLSDGVTGGGANSAFLGAAFAPIIAESLRIGIDAAIPVAEVNSFIQKCDPQVQNYFAQASLLQGAPTATRMPNLVALVATSAVILALGVAAGLLIPARDAAPVLPKAAPITYYYTADAQIILTDKDGIASSLNPQEARIMVNDEVGEALGWVILDARGAQMASGVGDNLLVPLEQLDSGDYSIMWQVASKEGTISIARRVFYKS